MRYRVIERQVIVYEWIVDADTPDEAEGFCRGRCARRLGDRPLQLGDVR